MKKRIVFVVATLCMLLSGSVIHASQPGEVSIHGFLSQGYLLSDDNNYMLANTEDGTFEFNEAGINFSTNAADNLRIGMQLFARDLGELGNDEINVNYAFADYSWREWLGLRAGLMKCPAGLLNEIRDVDGLRTMILLPSSIYSETMRDTSASIKGVGIYGNILLQSAGALNYQAMYGIYHVGNSLKDYMGNILQGTVTSFDMNKSFAGKLQWSTPLDGLRIVYSYTETSMEIGTSAVILDISSFKQSILSVEYLIGNFLIGGEYSWVDQDVYLNLSTGARIQDASSKSGTRGYLNLSYRFTDWFQLGGYYSVSESDKDYDVSTDPDNTFNELNDACLTLRFDINEYWIVKIEGHQIDGALTNEVAQGEGETEADIEDKWNLYAVKVSYNF